VPWDWVTLPPVVAATNRVAAVRFHGRNHQPWAQRDASRQRCYAYNYSPAELAVWVPKILAPHAGGRPVPVLLNILHGFAVRSAHTLASLLAQDTR
jgi:uncharacterized protein YecE (DUF72 family)